MVTLVAEVKGQETQKERVATVVDKIQVLKVEKDENVKKAEKAEAELRIVIKIKERQEKELKTFKDELDLNAASLSEVRDACRGAATHPTLKRWPLVSSCRFTLGC